MHLIYRYLIHIKSFKWLSIVAESCNTFYITTNVHTVHKINSERPFITILFGNHYKKSPKLYNGSFNFFLLAFGKSFWVLSLDWVPRQMHRFKQDNNYFLNLWLAMSSYIENR